MRVAVIGGFTPSLINFRGPMLRAMVERGHEVVAAAPEQDEDTIDRLAEIGVAFRQLPIERTGTNPLKDLKSEKAIEALLREIAPDKQLCYTIKPVIFGTRAAVKAGVPERYAMVTGLGRAFEPGGLKQKLITAAAKRLYRSALKHVKTVIVQNPDDQADLVRFGLAKPDQFAMINGSGVDTDSFAPVPLPEGAPRFLLIARLLADKGIREYVEAARLVKRGHPDATFTLVGPPDSNPSAISEEEVQSWVEEGVIDWPGGTSDVRPYLEQASIYVLPSYREGTPRTVLEAMSMGRPIITTDAPGCRETIEHGKHGFLVKVRDANSLAEAMLKMCADPALVPHMGARARERAVEKYDVQKVNAEILRIMGL